MQWNNFLIFGHAPLRESQTCDHATFKIQFLIQNLHQVADINFSRHKCAPTALIQLSPYPSSPPFVCVPTSALYFKSCQIPAESHTVIVKTPLNISYLGVKKIGGVCISSCLWLGKSFQQHWGPHKRLIAADKGDTPITHPCTSEVDSLTTRLIDLTLGAKSTTPLCRFSHNECLWPSIFHSHNLALLPIDPAGFHM